MDEIIPFLSQVCPPNATSREPAVIMSIVGIIKMTIDNPKLGLTKEVAANQVIPMLMPLSIENSLTVPQFNTLISLMKELMKKVEEEHRVKIEQLTAMRDQQSMAVITYGDAKNFNGVSKSVSMNSFSLNQNASQNLASQNSAPKDLASDPKKRDADLNIASVDDLFSTSSSSASPIKSSDQKRVPKDLTSTLISSNLSNLAIANANQATQQRVAPPFNQTPVTNQSMAAPSNPMSALSLNRYPNLQPTPSSITLSNQSYGSLSMNANQFRAPSSSASAFNDLLPSNLSTKSSVPLNQMKPMGGLLMPTPSSAPSSVTPTPALSKSDLEEFLK